ncbi:Uu.00g072260.m01.CDS01 [Anthostomella pinea]|uniref:Uu.00g072260.m01.CDS01 n=1 Tax=Anthostomella pinea TaxID=933095 RepID=A0AAI8YNY7_9PEZI|nr:Uu.00g072260.m01.CDS01 [Anthostomella pinea]
MKLYASGFNGWRQLEFKANKETNEPDDFASFQLVLSGSSIGRPWSSMSWTLVRTDAGIQHAGFPDEAIRSSRLEDKLLSSLAARAGNGIVAEYHTTEKTIHQQPSPFSLTHGSEARVFTGLGVIVQLEAYETGFVALTEDGRVWTWGDERYAACLGRETHSSPAETPGVVEELEGLPSGKITRIAAAGYIVLALTEGNDLYAWGGHPGRRAIVEGLSESPMPIVVEECDILDCSVGESHVIVLTTNGDAYLIGDNTNGQLGLPIDKATTWMKLSAIQEEGHPVVAVRAGQRSSFILTEG